MNELLNFRDVPKNDRPRERFLSVGKENLSDYELLVLLLKTGTKNKSVNVLAREVLDVIGGFENFKNLDYASLTKIKGIGMTKAIDLLLVLEIGKRVYLKPSKVRMKLRTASDIYKYVKYFFYDKKQEHFYCLYLDNKKFVINSKLLFVGTLNKSVVHPREVFKEAYLSNAACVVCVHNHPSGDLSPSNEDIHFTKVLRQIGEVQGIPIIDHLIVSNSGYLSFYEENIL